LASHQHGAADKMGKPFAETESFSSSQSGSGSPSLTSGSRSSCTSLQWSVKRQKLYKAMTEEQRGLFDELQDEIGELKCLLAATDGTAESKVHVTDLFIVIMAYCVNYCS